MDMSLKILRNLRDPFYSLIALGVAFIFFDINFYFMKNLPGSVNLMCVEGANFTTGNIVFSVFYSALSGIVFSGVVAVFKMRRAKMLASGSGGLTGAAMLIGALTVFCPSCTIPVVSLFGFSFGLSAFTDFNLAFKAASIVLMLAALWLLEKQLRDDCKICKK